MKVATCSIVAAIPCSTLECVRLSRQLGRSRCGYLLASQAVDRVIVGFGLSQHAVHDLTYALGICGGQPV